MLGIQTLNTLWDLLDSGFGWPSPRHGLNLLYWFANECVEVDKWNQITVLCDPSSRDFGFRLYHNNEGLLPVTNQPYFEVGNLNHEEARNLPDYVRREYNGYQYNNNADRIIICVDHDSVNHVYWFERVYVTEHIDLKNFNRKATYRISKGLLKNIRNLRLEVFLKLAGYQGEVVHQLMMIDAPRVVKNHVTIEVTSDSDSESDSFMNDRRINRYSDTSTRSRRRNRCCECTIL
ncbi:hypothetical protein AMEX_G27641 [Astyanax mexicanus]|uniref:Uncharacterized protein n=1 Tax=Astyanax mexicanus TaxID=7994 RepID=A0A8T2KSM3_ASTMX|nr:hypothetical protein AMEX_G27641 [Astyanax mexicanus]